MASIVDPEVKAEPQAETASRHQKTKREACIALLNQWLTDDSGYDEENWPKLKKARAENRTSNRSPFDA